MKLMTQAGTEQVTDFWNNDLNRGDNVFIVVFVSNFRFKRI